MLKKKRNSVVALPKDVWGIVIQYLDPESAFRLQCLSKNFLGLSSYLNEKYWARYVRQSFLRRTDILNSNYFANREKELSNSKDTNAWRNFYMKIVKLKRSAVIQQYHTPTIDEIKSHFNKTTSKHYSIFFEGAGAIGKSVAYEYCATGKIKDDYDPHIGDERRISYTIPKTSQHINLTLIDFPGQEEFSAMNDQYYRATDAFIVMFELNERNNFASFDTAKSDIEAIYRVKDTTRVPIVLVGTKIDLGFELKDYKEMKSKALELAKQYSIPYLDFCVYYDIGTKELLSVVMDEIVRLANVDATGTKAEQKKCLVM